MTCCRIHSRHVEVSTHLLHVHPSGEIEWTMRYADKTCMHQHHCPCRACPLPSAHFIVIWFSACRFANFLTMGWTRIAQEAAGGQRVAARNIGHKATLSSPLVLAGVKDFHAGMRGRMFALWLKGFYFSQVKHNVVMTFEKLLPYWSADCMICRMLCAIERDRAARCIHARAARADLGCIARD